MKNIIKILVFLYVFSFGFCFAKENMSEWKQVADNSYVNTETIFGTADIYGFNVMIKSYNKGQYEPINGKKIHYTISQYTIDCGRKFYKIGIIDSYSENGSFVNGDYNKYAKFRPIVAGTSISKVSEDLCRPVNNP